MRSCHHQAPCPQLVLLKISCETCFTGLQSLSGFGDVDDSHVYKILIM